MCLGILFWLHKQFSSIELLAKGESLGAIVKLLPCHLEVTDPNPRNNLCACGVMLCTSPLPKPDQVGASCVGPPLFLGCWLNYPIFKQKTMERKAYCSNRRFLLGCFCKQQATCSFFLRFCNLQTTLNH